METCLSRVEKDKLFSATQISKYRWKTDPTVVPDGFPDCVHVFSMVVSWRHRLLDGSGSKVKLRWLLGFDQTSQRISHPSPCMAILSNSLGWATASCETQPHAILDS